VRLNKKVPGCVPCPLKSPSYEEEVQSLRIKSEGSVLYKQIRKLRLCEQTAKAGK
jgi:hypothetical protein